VCFRPTRVVDMIGIEIGIQIGTEKRREFLESFETFSRTRNNRIQCVDMILLENVSMPNCFLWMERWDSEDDLLEYMNSGRFNELIGVVGARGKLQDLRVVESFSAQDWDT